MSATTAADRGDLAERLLPIAAGLACITHGDGDQRDIAHTLSILNQAERDALIVVLAGLVDPDANLAALLGYVTWDETGRPAGPRPVLTGKLRDIAKWRSVSSGAEGLLLAEQRSTAWALHVGRDVEQVAVAEQLGVHPVTVSRWLAAREERGAA
jgi:hypothetical protein